VTIQKPLIERISPRSASNLELDPDTFAAALGFGRVSQPATPLPENPTPARRVANTSEISLIDTRAKKPAPKPSLFSIVMARLDSLTPLSAEHQKLVTEMQAKVIPQLTAIDNFVSEIESARYVAIECRWEEVRVAGRKLISSLPALQEEQVEALHYCNASKSAKIRTQQAAEQLWHSRAAMQKSPWVSKAELKDADEKLERAKDEAVKANQKWLDDVKRMTAVEGKIEILRATLESYETELQRLQLELSGAAYFDQEFGLSTEPRFYREEKATIGG
jgi:hypothetical protein